MKKFEDNEKKCIIIQSIGLTPEIDANRIITLPCKHTSNGVGGVDYPVFFMEE